MIENEINEIRNQLIQIRGKMHENAREQDKLSEVVNPFHVVGMCDIIELILKEMEEGTSEKYFNR